MTTESEGRLERLQAASDTIGANLNEALSEQGKKAAANMLQLYGTKSCLDAGGFIYCVQNAHEAALLFLLEEEYVTLTEKGLAAEDEQSARKLKRKLHVEGLGDKPKPDVSDRGIPGAYL